MEPNLSQSEMLLRRTQSNVVLLAQQIKFQDLEQHVAILQEKRMRYESAHQDCLSTLDFVNKLAVCRKENSALKIENEQLKGQIEKYCQTDSNASPHLKRKHAMSAQQDEMVDNSGELGTTNLKGVEQEVDIHKPSTRQVKNAAAIEKEATAKDGIGQENVEARQSELHSDNKRRKNEKGQERRRDRGHVWLLRYVLDVLF